MGFEVINGDCLVEMPMLIERGVAVKAVATDPPYGLNFRAEDWDGEIPRWIQIARRMTPNVVFTTAPTTLWDYPRPDWVGCWYREASNSRTSYGGFNHWSPVVMYGDASFAVDSIKLHAIQHATSKDIEHPSPKPLELMRWIVRGISEVGDTIVDPFAGSFTTGVACVIEGRNFIGIEQSADYCAIGEARMRRASCEAVDIPKFNVRQRPAPLFDTLAGR